MDAKLESLRWLGERVRNLRLQEGYSQENLAEKCGFDRTYISLIERGRRNPSFFNLMKLVKGLDTSVSKLTSGIQRKALWPDEERNMPSIQTNLHYFPYDCD